MQTRRQLISDTLQKGPITARELARQLGVPIRNILSDLEHIQRTWKGKLFIHEAQCLECGFRFRKRERLSSPSRCFQCKSERIREPEFSIAAE